MELNDYSNFSNIDKDNLFKLISELPSQCQNAWIEISKIVLPSFYLKANKVLILGMGGSGIGGELARSFARSSSEIPIHTHHNYGIPAWVDEKTLVVAISYSGNTEEVNDAFVEAHEKGSKLVAITTGGELERLAFKFRAPLYRFRYQSPPRAALGYLFIGILGVLKKLNIVDLATQDIEMAITTIKAILEKNALSIPDSKNYTKNLAKQLYGKIPIIVGCDSTAAVAIRWKTQINENAKSAAYSEEIPECNHNSLVGLDFPPELNQKICFVVLESKFDNPRSKIRQTFFLDTLRKKKIQSIKVNVSPSEGLLSEMLGLVFLGDITSFYLAMLYEINPYPVEIISDLKKHLKESGSGKD